MAEFKLVIGNPKTGKSYQVVVTDENAHYFLGKKLGDKVNGNFFGFPGYEFEITGGADYCGFPMRKDIEGPIRKKILLVSGVGIRNKEKGLRKRKTVCGNTIHEKISQISMKIIKYGKKPIVDEQEKGETPEESKAQEQKEEAKQEERKEQPQKETKEKQEESNEK